MIGDSSIPVPHNRPNRRRARPGSRARHVLPRKDDIYDSLKEKSSQDNKACAHSSSDQAKPSPALQQNLEQIEAEAGQEEAAGAMLAAERVRIYGGYIDDMMSLCEPMLQVILSLFGSIDYVDP